MMKKLGISITDTASRLGIEEPQGNKVPPKQTHNSVNIDIT